MALRRFKIFVALLSCFFTFSDVSGGIGKDPVLPSATLWARGRPNSQPRDEDMPGVLAYLTAYMQRNPESMQSDPDHAASVHDWIDYAQGALEKMRKQRDEYYRQLLDNKIQPRSTQGLIRLPKVVEPRHDGGEDKATPTSLDWPALQGRYSMVHDGWRGTLDLSPKGSTYTSSDNKRFNVLVEGQGYHVIFYVTALGGQNADGKGGQKFDGYLMTQTRDAIAGLTWWEGQPFGFFARKG